MAVRRKQPSMLQLSRAGFDRAENLLTRKQRLECALLVVAVGAMCLEGAVAYALSVMALLLQALAWLARFHGLSTHRLSERAKRQALLLDALGSLEGSLELTDLRTEFETPITESAKRADAATYYSSSEAPGPARLRDLVLESAFWSKHLYRKSAIRSLRRVGLWLVGILTALFLSIPEASGDTRLLVARVLLLLLGSVVMFEDLGDGLSWLAASTGTERVCARAEHVNSPSHHQQLALFADYSAATVVAPPIPDGIYEREKDRLNSLWKTYGGCG